jgi:3-hydroxyacyl-[acyl-carrier-protein] dehydratase
MNNIEIDINQIMELIPHRYPFLLVDRVTKVEKGKSIEGIKNVTFNEPQFMGHFPNNPVMPGVLIIEALAQVSAVLVSSSIEGNRQEKLVYFMSIDKAKFRKIVRPGDRLVLKSEIIQNKGNVWKFSATAEIEGEVAAESEFMAMVKDKK